MKLLELCLYSLTSGIASFTLACLLLQSVCFVTYMIAGPTRLNDKLTIMATNGFAISALPLTLGVLLLIYIRHLRRLNGKKDCPPASCSYTAKSLRLPDSTGEGQWKHYSVRQKKP